VPTFTIRFADGSTEDVEAECVEQEHAHVALIGTAFVMNRPRRLVVRRVRHSDVVSVELAARA
jgi:hypothetical protein